MAKKEDDKLASSEVEKLDIEDIKDPLEDADKTDDVDLEEAVDEETVEESSSAKASLDKESGGDAESLSEPDELEKAQAEAPEDSLKEEKPKKAKKAKKPFPWKTVAIVVITFLVTAALVLGGIYYYQKTKAPKEEPVTENTANVEINVTQPETETVQKSVYVTVAEGLNLRQEPATTAAILVVIPYGTKIDVLEIQGDWYKTTYAGQTGWVSSTYTAAENPLVYKNSTYKFQMTFPSDWKGYKFFPIGNNSEWTDAWYVSLPTSDKNYTEGNLTKGYASMMALSVYSTSQWKSLQSGEGIKPTLVAQNASWVLAWSHPQSAPPSDLTNQSKETESVVKTIKFY